MALEKKAWDTQNIDQSAVTGLLDAVWSGMHKANEPSRGHALTSGVLHGTGRGLGHGLSSAATLLLLDKLMPGNVGTGVGKALKLVAGPVAGMIGGRLLPGLAGAAADTLRPSHSEGSERRASLKGGAMNVQELAKLALENVKKANGPDCGDMSGSYGEGDDKGILGQASDFVTKRRGPGGAGPSFMQMAAPVASALAPAVSGIPYVGGALSKAMHYAPELAAAGTSLMQPDQGWMSGLANAGASATGAALGRRLPGMAMNAGPGFLTAGMDKLSPAAEANIMRFLEQMGAMAGGSLKLSHDVKSVQGLAKLALEGSDPLNGQSAGDQGWLSYIHDALAKKRGVLGGASALQLGGEALGHIPGAGLPGRLAGPAMAAYSRMMEPGQSWPEGIAQGAVSGLTSAAGKRVGDIVGDVAGLDEGHLQALLGNIGSILGGNLKVGASKTKKASLTQPMGVPVKSEFTHDPMGEPMDMSAASQAGSMGTAAPKKDKKDGKDKKADDDSTAMRSFMGTWGRSKDIHAKSAAYKNFMSRVGKYQSME